jgi:sugar lactone lactonase YvrE
VLCACIAAHPAFASAQRPVDSAAALDRAAGQAYRTKDYGAFTTLERQALALDPDNARYLYDVACGEALEGHAGTAVSLLDSLLSRQLDLGAETDADFAGIRHSREWAGFESRLATMRTPIVRSSIAFTVRDPNLVATGIAVDPGTGDVYVASVRERKVIRRRTDGSVTDFVQAAQDGFLAGASLAIDTARQLLYATTADAPFINDHRKVDEGHSGVFAFDLRSGRTIRKAMLRPDGKKHFLNALVIDRSGNIYISDSEESGVYVLPAGAEQLEVFIPSTTFHAAQGLALSRDSRTLYVADYVDGVWAVDLDTRAIHRVDAPLKTWLGGLDGLSRLGDALVAVQIGVQPNRVLRLQLDPAGERITAVTTIEMNHPNYDGPIQGAIADHAFVYVANSQLRLGDGASGAFASDKARPTVVLRLPLP